MRRTCLLALATAFGLVAAGAPAAPDRAERACFNLGQVAASHLASPRRLLFRLHGGAVYAMDFATDCDVTDTTLILRPSDRSREVCGAPATVTVGARGGGLCLPTGLRRLTPDEIAALPRGSLP